MWRIRSNRSAEGNNSDEMTGERSEPGIETSSEECASNSWSRGALCISGRKGNCVSRATVARSEIVKRMVIHPKVRIEPETREWSDQTWA